MISYRTRKDATKVALPDVRAPGDTNKTVEVAAYIGELVRSVRQITRVAGQKDLAFLDYLLAMAEEESGCLAANAYH